MVRRRAVPARPLVALVLATALLPFAPLSRVEAACLPAAPSPASGCCPTSGPPACPACPADGRPGAPAAPKRPAACCPSAALLPDAARLEVREPGRGRSDGSPGARAAKSAARAGAADLRAVVAASSPPPRLLACTFRN